MRTNPPRAWIIATLTIAIGSGSGVVAVADALLAPVATPASSPAVAPRAVTTAAPITPVPAPAPVVVKKRDCGASWSVHFMHASATPNPDLLERLAPAVAFAKAHPAAKVTVDGHADPSGDELGNVVLSKRRASRVAAALKTQGLAPDRITERAFGAYAPVADDGDTELRRVRVTVREPDCNEEIR